MVKLAKTSFGFFAIAMQNQLVDAHELPRDAKKAAQALAGDDFDKWVSGLAKKGYDVEDGLFDPMKAVELIGVKEKEYLRFSRLVEIELAKILIKAAIGRDYLIIQTVDGLDDLNKSINIMINRLREWYGLHFPELKEEDHEKYLKRIIADKRGESMGIELSGGDKDAVQRMAKMILEMYKARAGLEFYLEKLMEEIAPNLTALAGANLGARLIGRAGSLKKLSEMPGSTIQVLGAERALFKHLRKGTPPPKHGVIFQHPEINRAQRAIRGRLARSLAAKLALASRTDKYAGKLNKDLIASWKRRLKEVKQ
ncbi:MAG: ribosomal biogenesis protein [Candidatus Altiarchaeota archaeon]|nr:ribosomal biogenesis protein [Candidatus Altiarchaeota archaeon]